MHFVRLLLLCNAAVLLAYIADAAIRTPSSEPSRMLDLDGEANLPTWYSSAKLLVLGLLLGIFAKDRIRTAGSLHGYGILLIMPALSLALSLDEVAMIHEWIGQLSDSLLPTGHRSATALSRTGIWMFLLGVPFLVVTALAWTRFIHVVHVNRRAVRLYLSGFAAHVASALGTEILSNFVSGAAYVAQVATEEFGEMVGVTLMIGGSLELLRSYGIDVRSAQRPGQAP